MSIQQKGELQLLREIKERFDPIRRGFDNNIIVGIGDDSAVFKLSRENIVVTTDLMAEGVHFDLSYTSAFHLGFKLVSVNVSDIYAMGGTPNYIFLNIALKRDTPEKFFWDLFAGIDAANSFYGMILLGGDISEVLRDSMVSATVIGSAKKIIRRNGAKVGDKIFITNTTGDSACGMEILKRLSIEDKDHIKNYRFGLLDKEERFNKKNLVLDLPDKRMSIDFSVAEPLIKRHLVPEVTFPIKLDIDKITALIDISDGLFIDLFRLCEESKVGARIFSNRLPISKELLQVCSLLGLNPRNLVTAGGEDYELLFTAPEDQSSINSSLLKAGVATCIGEIIDDKKVIVESDGNEIILKPEGYQHFST